MYIKINIPTLKEISVHVWAAGLAGFLVGLSLGLPWSPVGDFSFEARVSAPKAVFVSISPRVQIALLSESSHEEAIHAYDVPSFPEEPQGYTVPPLPLKTPVLVVPVKRVSAPAPSPAESLHKAAPVEQAPPSLAPTPEVAPSPLPVLASGFPEFGRAIHPVTEVPNWAAMKTPAQWNRTYAQMTESDFVPIPRYDLSVLTTPMESLLDHRGEPDTDKKITAKLYYSTRFFGAYDLDAAEWTGIHPGVDLKLPIGTPIGSLAGGRVAAVRSNAELGTYVMIEHRHPTAGTFYSIYGHLGSTRVAAGDTVTPGQMIGTVGMTGNTGGPHLHLQVDRGVAGETSHTPYLPNHMPSPAEAGEFVVSPITFISLY